MDLCKVPELAAEVAMGPIRDFDFDVAILFSDLLFPLEALGLGLTYEPGPKMGWHLQEESDLKRLHPFADAIEQLKFQKEAMRLTRQMLPNEKSLIGFVGGPWTLFSYAAEGDHSGSLKESKRKISLFDPFCEHLMPLLLANIELQFEGGAEVVMIFDTSAGELDPFLYRRVVVPKLQILAERFAGRLGYYAKGVLPAHYDDPSFQKLPWAGMGFDHRWDLSGVLRNEVIASAHKGFIQGNFDQALLFLTNDEFEREARRYFKRYQELSLEDRAGWVCGLGHGVLPGTPEDNVRRFVDLARELFR